MDQRPNSCPGVSPDIACLSGARQVSHCDAAALTNDPRLIEMVSAMQDIISMNGCVTYADLTGRGFTTPELLEYEHEARGLISSLALAGHNMPTGDRVPAIIDKLLASAPHLPPKPSAFTHTAASRGRWASFCTARAAFKLDPWPSQAERCLQQANGFLDTLPLLPPEKNRVVAALAKAQRGHIQPGGRS